MLLTPDELQSLVGLKFRSPHQFLGMHPLADGNGVVARVLIPEAAEVRGEPVHEKNQPALKLKRIHESGVFEGVTKQAKRVFAYDLVVTDRNGKTRRGRDAFSFLPTISE